MQREWPEREVGHPAQRRTDLRVENRTCQEQDRERDQGRPAVCARSLSAPKRSNQADSRRAWQARESPAPPVQPKEQTGAVENEIENRHLLAEFYAPRSARVTSFSGACRPCHSA